jgi:ferric-dicitrate binding protein FerR (iron transport regulator)
VICTSPRDPSAGTCSARWSIVASSWRNIGSPKVMDRSVREIKRRDEHRRRAQAAEWWLKLRVTEPTANDVRAWLNWQERDPRNAEAFDGVRELVGRIQAMDANAVSALIAEFSKPAGRLKSRWLSRSVSLGAATAALATAAVGYRLLAVLPAQPARLQYVTPIAINRNIAMPDGSIVVLGADSELSATFTVRARHVQLSYGEAYFKVKHDEHRPFYVQAGNLTIRDVGTAFDVLKTGERITVTVARGRVQVTEPGTTAGSAAFQMRWISSPASRCSMLLAQPDCAYRGSIQRVPSRGASGAWSSSTRRSHR